MIPHAMVLREIRETEAWCTPGGHVMVRVFGDGFAEVVVFDVNCRFSRWHARGFYDLARSRMLVDTAEELAAWLRSGLGFTGIGGDA